MNPTRFTLLFSDPALAKALADAKPPEGVKISVSRPFMQASDSGFLIVKAVFDFSMSIQVNVPSTVFIILAGWIAKKLHANIKHRKNKSSRINGNVIPLNKRNILLVIEKDIAAQIERDTQRREDDDKKKSSRDELV
jgi:hypothetical protein